MTDNLRAMARHQPAPSGVSMRTDNLDTMAVAKLLAGSGFFGEVREQGQALAKILAGAELGIGPIASLMGIYLQKGRLSFSANIMASIVKRSGRYTYRVRSLENDGCTIEFFEGSETIGTSSFTDQDAQTAGLTDGNWLKFRRNMMFARAMSNGCKWFCPDVFGGATPYTPDEIGPSIMSDDGDMRPVQSDVVDVTPVGRELCDADQWNRRWHVLVNGTRFAEDDIRHKFVDYHTKGEFNSLTAFLAQATTDAADGLLHAVDLRITAEAKKARAALIQELEAAIKLANSLDDSDAFTIPEDVAQRSDDDIREMIAAATSVTEAAAAIPA